MSDSVIEETPTNPKAAEWAERLAAGKMKVERVAHEADGLERTQENRFDELQSLRRRSVGLRRSPTQTMGGSQRLDDACHCRRRRDAVSGACNRTEGRERPEMPPGYRSIIDREDGPTNKSSRV